MPSMAEEIILLFHAECLLRPEQIRIQACTAAIGSLKGPRHGGANLKVAGMHDCIKENVSDWNNEGEVADFLRKILRKEAYDKSGLIYGGAAVVLAR